MARMTAAGVLLAMMLLLAPAVMRGQDPPATTPPATNPQTSGQPSSTPPSGPPAALDDTIEAGDDEVGRPARQIVSWNEYEGKYLTFRFGAGFLYEWASYGQDDESKEQFALYPEARVRDARLLLSGRLKFERPVSWSTGIMYDPPTERWLFRQTQIMVEVPELLGHIVVGRTKEGVSLNKVMIGYAGWTMERTMMSDTIPILADGIKWLGYVPEKHLLWNLGVYTDWISEGQTFSTYEHQVAARVAWLPLISDAGGKLVHVGLNLRYGKAKDGMLQVRSRPEVFPASFFVDTGRFAVDSTLLSGVEAYYRPGPLLLGTEYYFQNVDSPEHGDPVFHGGDVFVSWLPTGETRAYNTRGGYFNQISPKRSVDDGGPGAWELVGRFSFIDLDSGDRRGGKFWRFTPMVNWHMSDNIRFEFAYGYGRLDRFDLEGSTHFYQSRIQLQF